MADSGIRLTPPPSPPSPSASFYDVSDDEENEYNTIAHSRSGRGVKLLFSKSKVCPFDYSPVISSAVVFRNGILTREYLNRAAGLCPSHAFIEGQYPWVHCPDSAEARSRRESLHVIR